jgi:hypothetical protein
MYLCRCERCGNEVLPKDVRALVEMSKIDGPMIRHSADSFDLCLPCFGAFRSEFLAFRTKYEAPPPQTDGSMRLPGEAPGNGAATWHSAWSAKP